MTKTPAPTGPLTLRELELWRTLEGLAGSESLMDWVPILNPGYLKPEPLRPLVDIIVESHYSQVEATVSVPPRFGKTETIMQGIIWRLLQDPTLLIIYCSYSAAYVYAKSRRMMDIAERAGLQLRAGSKKVSHWETAAGGGLMATSIGGPITGFGCNWLVIDDALKNREEAESVVIREKQWDWFSGTAMSRVEPGGSILLNATRWHDDDIIGRAKHKFPEWRHCNLQAVTEYITRKGETKEKTLWPERWPMKDMTAKRRLVGEYEWNALYQGNPRPKGGRLFKPCARYDIPFVAENNVPYKIVIGADPAATEKTSADYSVAIVMAFSGTWNSLDFRADILDLWKGQVEIPKFVEVLRDMAAKWHCPIAVEAVAGFKAVPQMLRNLDKKLQVIEAPALGDKFTRALPVSAAWNDGRVRVPHAAPWVYDFLGEIEKFTGVKDARDDQVDALAHAYNSAQMLVPQVISRPIVPKKSNLPFG